MTKSEVENTSVQEKTTKEKISQLEKLADRLERMRVGDYVNNMNRTGRVIWLGFMGGVSRGFGLTVGATLVIAIAFKIISMLISWNVPYLSDMMQDAKQALEERNQTTQVLQDIKSVLQETKQILEVRSKNTRTVKKEE